MGMLRCTRPMPPWRAIAMARRDSVTVSIAAEARGMSSDNLRVKQVRVSTSAGSTEDLPGRRSTSSKVRPSGIGPSIITASFLKINALKQRSPAGGRWAGRCMHQIAKINHCETSILGGKGIAVKLVASYSRRHYDLSPLQKINEFFACESHFPQQLRRFEGQLSSKCLESLVRCRRCLDMRRIGLFGAGLFPC